MAPLVNELLLMSTLVTERSLISLPVMSFCAAVTADSPTAGPLKAAQRARNATTIAADGRRGRTLPNI
jgi:hypothetical protein